MRTLHNIGKHERLIASGQYRYRAPGDGQQTGKVEHWNLHRLPDGSSVLRADVDGRETAVSQAGEESVLVHMLLDPDGQADRLHVRYQDDRRKAEAQLTFFPGYALVSRFVNGQALPRTETDVPGEAVVIAPCCASNAAHAYDESKGGQQSFPALDLDLEGSGPDLLVPRLRTLTLSMGASEEIELEGVGRFLTRHLIEDGVADLRLDLHDVLLTRNPRDGNVEDRAAVLAQYTRFDG